MKKSKLIPALFAALLVISALSGCGKGNDEATNTYGVGIGYPGYTGGGAVATQFTVGGALQVSNATGWIYGSLAAGGGAVGGTPYMRTNQSGDQVILQLAGTPQQGGVGYSSMNGSATVYLSQSTVSYVQYYCGGSPTGIAFPSGAALVGGAPNGTISGQVLLLGASGQACIYL